LNIKQKDKFQSYTSPIQRGYFYECSDDSSLFQSYTSPIQRFSLERMFKLKAIFQSYTSPIQRDKRNLMMQLSYANFNPILVLFKGKND